jgi:RNA polymerase sigma factor (sigma-70 family)
MDNSEYTRFFRKYWKELWYTCIKRIRNEQVAKDIAETAMIKIWERFNKYETEQNAKAVLFICAINLCKNHYNNQKIKSYIPIEIALDPPDIGEERDVPMVKSETIINICEQFVVDEYIEIEADVINFIFEQIETLPKEKRRIILLFMKGLNSDEIAKRCHNTRKTVLNQKLKAIKMLHEKLKLKFSI